MPSAPPFSTQVMTGLTPGPVGELRDAAGGAGDVAVRLGVPRDRINTVIALEAASEPGTKAESSMTGTSTAALAADGNIREIRDAVAELGQRHTRQIALTP